MTYTLGIGDVTHDKSVCLMKEDKIIAMIEEERLTRVKHGVTFDPTQYTILDYGKHVHSILDKPIKEQEKNHRNLIQYCLDKANIKYDDIESIVTSSLFPNLPFRYESVYLHHHIAHCASAFYPSQFDKAAILIVDGYGVHTDGNSESTMYAFGEENKISVLDTIEGYCDFTEEEKKLVSHRSHMIFKNSLGVFYQNISVLLGLGSFSEGKTMGLAPYGEINPQINNKIKEHIDLLPDGKLAIDNRNIFLYCKKIIEEAKSTLDKEKLFKFYANLAFMHQKFLEEMILHLCHHLYCITQSPTLCLAGGVVLNSVANAKILTQTPFKKIFIQPAAGDNGISMGCALYGAHALKNIPRKYYKKTPFSPYLGKIYTKEEIEKAVHSSQGQLVDHGYIKNPEEKAAEYISQGKVVAWFHGASEIGLRALGNRSILADPRDPKMKDYLNKTVKHREFFRPYAPAVLEEKTQDYFELNQPAPYMLIVPFIKQEKRRLIPAVTHIDGTTRVQTVNKKSNSAYHKLIKAFEKITGVPIVLNTSFNLVGKPIVETPEDALRCFLKTDIDILFISGRLFTKHNIGKL